MYEVFLGSGKSKWHMSHHEDSQTTDLSQHHQVRADGIPDMLHDPEYEIRPHGEHEQSRTWLLMYSGHEPGCDLVLKANIIAELYTV